MKLRQHKGSYSESMATTVEIEPTYQALLQSILSSGVPDLPNPLTKDHLGVTLVSIDPRNGWKTTHIVTIKDWGVYGYTDGSLTP
jgi:hypothetical protein